MTTNPFIRIMEPILAGGFIVHIVYSIILTIQNMRARGSKSYASGNKTPDVEWSSKNMFVLVYCIIVIFGNSYCSILGKNENYRRPTFRLYRRRAQRLCACTRNISNHMGYDMLCNRWYSISISLITRILVGFHTVGLSNSIWIPRLQK
jgi:hypothetical protein